MTGGRPRSAGAGAAILAAARELLGEGGFEAVTMEGVAARAGVAKTTVYRRYPNRTGLIAAAVFEVLGTVVPGDDRGSLRADLAGVLDGLYLQNTPLMTEVFLRLLTEALRDGPTRQAVDEHLLGPRRQVAAALLGRAAERGELVRPCRPDTLIELVGGGLIFRAAMHGGRLDQAFLDEVLGLLVAGLTNPDPPEPPRRRNARGRKES